MLTKFFIITIILLSNSERNGRMIVRMRIDLCKSSLMINQLNPARVKLFLTTTPENQKHGIQK